MDSNPIENPQIDALQARSKSFERHLIVDRGIAPRTAAMRRLVIRKFLAEWRTLTPTKERVQGLKEAMVLEGYHRDYVGNVCRSFRDYGVFIGVDLAVKSPPREPTRVPRWLTEQEVQAILFVIDSVRDRALFYLMAYSGVRVAELVALREDVNFDKRTVTIQLGKGGKSQEIPLSQHALDPVAAYLRSGSRVEASPWLFQAVQGKHRGAKLSTQAVRVLCRRYAKTGGVTKQVSPHMFRHALASNLLSNGCPLPFVQRQLRHSRIETTMRYLHLSDKAHRENYERFLPSY